MSDSNRIQRASRVAVLSLGLLFLASTFYADTNIDPSNKYTWGANSGWMNWAASVTYGASLINFSAGFIYSANTGWINLGDGTPDNGVAYSNASATDFGLNIDRITDPNFILLSGLVWAANTGWINFDVATQIGAANRPRISKTTGALSGFAWSANMGWIPLNSAPTAIVTVTQKTASSHWEAYR